MRSRSPPLSQPTSAPAFPGPSPQQQPDPCVSSPARTSPAPPPRQAHRAVMRRHDLSPTRQRPSLAPRPTSRRRSPALPVPCTGTDRLAHPAAPSPSFLSPSAQQPRPRRPARLPGSPSRCSTPQTPPYSLKTNCDAPAHLILIPQPPPQPQFHAASCRRSRTSAPPRPRRTTEPRVL
jgi:hypothetical protein